VSGAAVLQLAKPVAHVYVHDVPLQPTAVAFPPLHALPQPPQLAVVASVVHVPLHKVSRHVQEPPEQSGVGCAQVAWFCHVPVALQVCGVLPLQLV
jgi:hypothetical protein